MGLHLKRLAYFITLLLWLPQLALATVEKTEGKHAIAMHGEPKYPADFTHFEYVNPNAPKGGSIVLSGIGAFDKLNPFVLKGIAADKVQHLTFDTLTVSSYDEAFSQYGLVAEKIQIASDRKSVTFFLNEKAKFQDGKPVTAEDVKFSFEILMSEGLPFYSAYYADVESTDIVNAQTITFKFKTDTNRELPLILGQLPVLPKHLLSGRNFNDDLLTPIIGSGPYRISDVKVGHHIVYERNKDYWAKDLPVNKGMYNFDQIRIDYYRDQNVALEGFKSGSFDFQEENSSKRWATLYEGDPFDKGIIIKEEIRNHNPSGMQAFIYNTRKDLFKDPLVREALNYAFDFEWTNKNLFYSAYQRTGSYFANSELAAKGLPSKGELELLLPHKDELPKEVFENAYQPPITDGSGNIRDQLRVALRKLKSAGWIFKDKKLVNKETGAPFKFEILLYSKDFERVVLPFLKNLEKLGIDASVRLMDSSQYIKMVQDFEFDMVIYSFRQSNSPGNEQRDFWYSGFADRKGSRNVIGIKDPVVDELINKVIDASTRQDLVTACRALDRVLLWSHYVIPQWHINKHRVAYKAHFRRPAIAPKYELGFDSWWVEPTLQTP